VSQPVDWKPIELSELEVVITHDLAACSDAQRQFFEQIRIPPARWRQHPWGDEGGGFWAVAVFRGCVVWYNDIEEGFNVSSFETNGEIPRNEYWCQQDCLCVALRSLVDTSSVSGGL
jgi:hypothetical protein